MRGTVEWLDGRLQIPERLRAAPQVRPVLDRAALLLEGVCRALATACRYLDIPRKPFLAVLHEVRAASGGGRRDSPLLRFVCKEKRRCLTELF